MKKRKILVSLALASACLFSLAACGKTEEPTPTPTATTTTTNDSLAVTFKARYSDGTPEEELTALAKSVKSGEKVAKPADPTKDGYRFVGFETANGAAFDFNQNITKATTVYAYFDKVVSAYDTIAESTNKYLAYNFNDTNAETDLETAFPLLTNESVGTGDVVFEGHKLKLVNQEKSETTKNDGHAAVVFENELKNCVVKGTVSLASSRVDTLNFIHFYEVGEGQSGGKYEIGATSKGLRYNGSEDENTAIESEKEYVYNFELDLLNQKITVTVDGQETAIKNASIDFNKLKRIDFGSTKGKEGYVTIDSLAIEVVGASLDDGKTVAKADLLSAYNAYVTSDKHESINDNQWKGISDAKTAGDTAIEAATDFDTLATALTTAENNMNTAVNQLRTYLVSSIKNGLNAWTWSSDSTAQANYNAGSDSEKTAYDAALTALKGNYVKAGATKATIAESNFASAKAYLYVKNESNELVAVAADAQYSATTDYYYNFELKYNKTGETEYTSTPVTIKELATLQANFINEAKAIVKEKVDVTVKYLARSFAEATGITAFATGVDYYTLNDVYAPKKLTEFKTGVTYYTKSGTTYTENTAEFDANKTYYVKTQNYVLKEASVTEPVDGVTYYTLGYASAGADGTYKVIKDDKTSLSDVPTFTNHVILAVYSNEVCTTAFDFDNTDITAATTLYAVVGEKVTFINATNLTGNQTGDATKFGPDASKVALDANVTYSAKNNAVLENSKFDSTLKIEGESVTKYLNSNGRSDANKGWFEIDLTAYPGKKAIISVYLTSSTTATREIWLSTLPTDIENDTKKTAAADKKIASETVANSTTTMTTFTTTLDASNCYVIVDNKVFIYAISVIIF